MAIIDKPSDYFISNLHTGNGGTQNITSLDFQADLIWIKQRNEAQNNRLIDSVRGNTKEIFSDLTTAEQTLTNGITAFNSNGFGLGSSNGYNKNSGTYVTWNWKAGGSASTNENGSIDSSVSANQDAGFSIVSWTGNATAGATIGHGLGVAPSMLILKKTSASGTDWFVYHKSIGANYYLGLNQTYDKQDQILAWNDTAPTSSVFSVGSGGSSNGSGASMITYCFAEKQGYSKFGSYTGNGSTDGAFIYTGFKPAWFMIKRADAASYWTIFDNKRSSSGGSNEIDYSLDANVANAEETGTSVNDVDFLSNGIKIREDNGDLNASGGTIIYMAFAENPFVTSSGVPATAR